MRLFELQVPVLWGNKLFNFCSLGRSHVLDLGIALVSCSHLLPFAFCIFVFNWRFTKRTSRTHIRSHLTRPLDRLCETAPSWSTLADRYAKLLEINFLTFWNLGFPSCASYWLCSSQFFLRNFPPSLSTQLHRRLS